MVGTRLLILVASAMAPAAAGATDVALQFVTAANRGDYRTVCRLYSARYVKSQASCRSLYRWGAGLYGPFDYSIVRWSALKNGHRRVDLTRWHGPSFMSSTVSRRGGASWPADGESDEGASISRSRPTELSTEGDTMSPSRKRVLATLVGIVIVATAAIGSGAAPASVDSAQRVCGVFKGPAWKSKQYGNKGTAYQVSVDRISCALAMSWSKKLVRKPNQGLSTPLPGPAGWTCVVHPGGLDFTRAFAAWGRCDKGSVPFARGPVFTWFPKLA